MVVYRICKQTYADDLSGTGAGLYGGRWNPKGMNLLYTAGSISLACLEYLVHNIHLMPPSDVCLSILEVHEDATIALMNRSKLPVDWNEKTYLPQSTQEIGKSFVEKGKSYMLKVPSAIVPGEFNYLLNPHHSSHHKTKIVERIVPFELDDRLFR